ncbi:Uncharacterized protein PRO82_000356 [Candidatus Protochlamydia amoebophila]|uniref:hypothetical protein n=1 Tax=Candidatus Protochlamydia amoebophila TaxID=362787 RepID=UPI001BC932BF|nr:hypothetical protein [Candidatus Protochlamydia amoebophila]MBS4163067.1 Uncharacterized protein [Candidatus Protochlamydia amoebophila]
MLVLVDANYRPVAKLIPNQEIEILDLKMKERLEITGISVDKGFKEKYHTGWKVYPKDDKAVFAKAFELFYFVHGLQQQNYRWEGPEALERLKLGKLDSKKLAQRIIDIHMENRSSKK